MIGQAGMVLQTEASSELHLSTMPNEDFDGCRAPQADNDADPGASCSANYILCMRWQRPKNGHIFWLYEANPTRTRTPLWAFIANAGIRRGEAARCGIPREPAAFLGEMAVANRLIRTNFGPSALHMLDLQEGGSERTRRRPHPQKDLADEDCMDNSTLNIEQAAAYLKLGQKAFRALFEAGDIPGVSINQKHMVFLKSELDDWIRRMGREQSAERRNVRTPRAAPIVTVGSRRRRALPDLAAAEAMVVSSGSRV